MQLTRNRANRKTVGRPKGGASAAPAISVGLCWQQFKAGSKLLHVAKQTSQHPPSPKLCVQNQRATQQAITLADVNFTPILQGQSHPRTVKNRETPGARPGKKNGEADSRPLVTKKLRAPYSNRTQTQLRFAGIWFQPRKTRKDTRFSNTQRDRFELFAESTNCPLIGSRKLVAKSAFMRGLCQEG